MDIKKSFICVLLAASLAVFSLCGCSGTQTVNTTAGETENTDVPGTTASETFNTNETSEVVLTRPTTPALTEPPETTQEPPATTVPPTPTTTINAGELKLNIPPPSTDTRGFSDEQLFSFFDDAVFVGDSISLGWRNYVTTKRGTNPGFMGGAKFLVSGSLGAANSLWEYINTTPNDGIENSVHPTYQGQQMFLWNSIPLTGAKKVFIMFGLNDVALYGVDNTVKNFDKLINKIKANVPDAQFYILSATYMLKGSERGALTSANLRKLDAALIDFCLDKGYPFINIADALADTDGNLKAIYCSDGYVHQTNAAYDVWTALLKGFAAANMPS